MFYVNTLNRYLLTAFSGAFLMAGIANAQTIKVKENQIVDKSVKYNHVTLDLSHGNFVFKPNVDIDIENSTIDVVISPAHPNFIYLPSGSLTFKNNIVNVTVEGIAQTPEDQAAYNLIKIDKGIVDVIANRFSIDVPYTVNLFKTNENFHTNGITFTDNQIYNFHGGVYLYSSDNANISNNIFTRVSFANVFSNGALNQIVNNKFFFSGNLSFGTGVVITNSDNANITNNIIASSSSNAILILGSKNISLDNNKLTDCLSYGVFIQDANPAAIKKDKYLSQIMPVKQLVFFPNDNIALTRNLFSQNRYGLAGQTVTNLTATDNIFIQRFDSPSNRQFWTNNDVLLPSVTNLVWENNLYKEAFTQENGGDNTLALKFVPFPAHGGVALP